MLEELMSCFHNKIEMKPILWRCRSVSIHFHSHTLDSSLLWDKKFFRTTKFLAIAFKYIIWAVLCSSSALGDIGTFRNRNVFYLEDRKLGLLSWQLFCPILCNGHTGKNKTWTKDPNLTLDFNAYGTLRFVSRDKVSEVDAISLEKFLSLDFCLYFQMLK